MSEIDEAREKIKWDCVHKAICGYINLNEATDQILNLTWPDGSKMFGVISQDQSLPSEGVLNGLLKETWELCQGCMLKANFRRMAKE